MKNMPSGWTLSQRDGGNRFIGQVKPKILTEKEKEEMKKRIIIRHEKLGLSENLKKELYPELFG